MTFENKSLIALVVVCGLMAVRYEISWLAASSHRDVLALAPPGDIAHLDHRPRHGGLVLMRGDTHFEITISRDGGCMVFFTDATRMPLPASFASMVTIGLADPAGARSISLRPDDSDRAWVGTLGAVTNPSAIVRITYAADGESPYWIDVPIAAWSLED